MRKKSAAILGSLISFGVACDDSSTYYGDSCGYREYAVTHFAIVNDTGEELLYESERSRGPLHPDERQVVWGVGDDCCGDPPAPATAIQCVRVLRASTLEVVYQITPLSAVTWRDATWTAGEPFGLCRWLYECSIKPEDLALIPEHERCDFPPWPVAE